MVSIIDLVFIPNHAVANLDLLRRNVVYLINRKGTGRARQEIPPSRLAAGATPILMNIGRAAMGIAQARIDRRMVFAETALAA